MNGKKSLDEILDQACEGIRDTQPDPARESQIVGSVWNRVKTEIAPEIHASEHLRSCEDFQGLLDDFVAHRLPEAKHLLVKEHVRECVACRRELKRYRNAGMAKPASPRRSSSAAAWTWRLAAAAAIVVTLIGLDFKTDLFEVHTQGWIEIENVDGEVVGVRNNGESVPLVDRQRVNFSDFTGIRTTKGSGAVLRLPDDSTVEMDERAELALFNRKKIYDFRNADDVIALERGNIIVEAADQGDNRLYVQTDDCEVEVKGTVFSVNHGTKGSRVSVIEGEVQVDSSIGKAVLEPGDQTVTTAHLSRIPIEQEIAWSRNFAEHMQLMSALVTTGKEIAARLEQPGQRFDTELLDRVPADTMLYVAVPNVSTQLAQAYEMLEQKVGTNDVLNRWWTQTVQPNDIDDELRNLMQKVNEFGSMLGDEVVLTLPLDQFGQTEGPVLIARLQQPEAFRQSVLSELDRLGNETGRVPDIRLLETSGVDTATGLPADGSGEAYIWTTDRYVVLTNDETRITELAMAFNAGRSSFVGTPFHEELRGLYRDGVEWVIGVDVARLFEMTHDSPSEDLERLGLLDLQTFIYEGEQVGDRMESSVELAFDQPRKGLASWLAEPAPMGALEFISPDATVAAAFVMREPTEVIDELFQMIGEEAASEGFDQFREATGVDLREDFAATLGGEFAMAVDGPLLPNPSWKMIFEVYDSNRLQQTIARAVEQINQTVGEAGSQGIELIEQQAGGRTFYELRSRDIQFISAHYTYVDGYMLAGASRALLRRTLRDRQAGIMLTNSARFNELIPADSSVNFSGMMYQDLSRLSGALAAAGEIPQLGELLGGIGEATGPSLMLAYGESEAIRFESTSQGDWLTSSLFSVLNWQTTFRVSELLSRFGEAVDRTYVLPEDRTTIDG